MNKKKKKNRRKKITPYKIEKRINNKINFQKSKLMNWNIREKNLPLKEMIKLKRYYKMIRMKRLLRMKILIQNILSILIALVAIGYMLLLRKTHVYLSFKWLQ